ncbi:Protein of unknown function [Thermobacillus xylanilyticus]|uniref:Uncharacterized protein n=1 Tax=Thermobacillus xylanilyticus TaxID=76633 RepID=A0ABN7RWT8_THEXY|nr:Protein of unknown function [Thermobacillus xylanilyticus]
MMPPWAMKK